MPNRAMVEKMKAKLVYSPRHHYKLLGLFLCVSVPLECGAYFYATQVLPFSPESRITLLIAELVIDLIAISLILAYDRRHMLKFFYQLRAANENLEISLEAGKMGIWEIDFKKSQMVLSPIAQEVYGFDKRTVNRSEWEAIIFPEDRDQAVSNIDRTKSSKESYWSAEYRIRHPINGTIWILESGRFYYNNKGEPVRGRGVCRDITVHKIREERMRQNNEMLKVTQNLAKIGSWEYDLTYKNFKWSDQMYDLFDLPKLGKLGAPPVLEAIQRVHPEDRALVDQIYSLAISGKSGDRTYRVIVRGEIRHYLVSATALPNEKRVVGFAQDVTEKFKAESKIIEQERMLQNSTRITSLAEMAAGIAHEIQNPIAGIRLKTDVIKRALIKGKQPSDLIGDMDSIQADVARCVNIISSMKLLSRDASALEKEPFNPETVIRQTLDLCTTKMTNRGIKHRVDFPETPIRALGVPALLSQVLINLISNAIDAVSTNMPEQPRNIILKVFEKDGKCAISVCDTGPGIAPEIEQKIFLPFFTTKPVGHGTGLGLSISKSILQKNGGDLELTHNHPTTFAITLPLAEKK